MIEHKILHKKLSVETQENNRKSELVLKIFFSSNTISVWSKSPSVK